MKKLLWIFILACWLTSVLSLLWFPSVQVSHAVSRITFYDKYAHMVFFGVMFFLFMSVGVAWDKFKFSHLTVFSFTLVTLINILGEYVQKYIPGRDPSYLDFLAGLIGTIIAIPLTYMLYNSPREKVLLHICCAPCASAVAEILEAGHWLEFYFFNPNIHPESEYKKRLEEVKKLAKYFGVKLKIEKYNHNGWLQAVKGREDDPEGGIRCELCFAHRLQAAADYASRKNIHLFATTLSISPHKNSYLVNKTGLDITAETGQPFLVHDFKEDNGWQRSLLLSKKFGFYRQKYCGCEFSARNVKRATHNG
jgi:predicted adenine nucleotide alpha hydrolase (AANH) superfamily ATPase/VanZ family protein